MRPQRFPLVRRAKQPTTLEQRDHFGNEDLQHRRQHGRHDVEAIGRAIVEPFLHQIGDLLRRAREGVMPTRTGESRQQLPQGGLLPTHQLQDDFGPAARRFHGARVGEIVRCEGRIQRQMREVMPPETARETLAPDVWIRQCAQFLRQPLRFDGT